MGKDLIRSFSNTKDIDIAREFIELGYRGIGHGISRQEFQERKQRVELALQSRRQGPRLTIRHSLTVMEPFARALVNREEANRTTRFLTIIFLRDRNDLGQQISAYIDYAHRLKNEDLTEFFAGQKKLVPLPADLSYYNWNTHMCTSNDTTNFHLFPHVEGIRFRCKHDRKVVDVDPDTKCSGDGTMRTTSIRSLDYLQIILHDHYLRRKKF